MTKHVSMAALTRGMVAVRADGDDLPKLIHAMNSDFEEFKATLETKDKELAAKFDDVVTTDKLEKLNAHIGNMQAAVDQANAKLAAIEMGGAGGGSAIVDPEYTASFEKFFRDGDEDHAVKASLKKAPDSDGGYLAPQEWDRTVTDALIEVSPMRQICGMVNTSRNGFTKLYNLRGTASGWVTETGARAESATATFASLAFPLGELFSNPAASQGVLDDAEVDLDAWLAGEVETEFAFQEGLAFVSGDGTEKPRGFLTYVAGGASAGVHPLGNIEVIAAGAATLDEDDILDLVYALPSAFTGNARFVMNRTTTGTVRKIKDTNGALMWQPSLAAGQPATLAGYPVTEIPGMPDVASTSLPIAFGDFERGYLIVDRLGIRLLRDPYTNKPFVMFYTTKRVGGGVNQPEALKILQMPV